MSKTNLPKISEILKEEFMEPYGLSSYALAKAIGVSTSRIQDILHNRRKITAETSIRLGRYFGVPDRYFLDLQNDDELRKALKKIEEEEIALADAALREYEKNPKTYTHEEVKKMIDDQDVGSELISFNSNVNKNPIGFFFLTSNVDVI